MVTLDHAAPHFPAPRLELSFQKRVGHRQRSDLGMQVPDQIFIYDRGIAATAFKDTGRAIQQRPFPLVDHRQMHAEPARQPDTVSSPFSASSATFALNSGGVLFSF
ncbi:hypothetical protein ACEWPM_017600 [Roseovarius sp. S4756]|uniref:hypothetical protein n=1 Tax=Roseovarius maritimus TaxID=3342637 RepID=UPI00372D53A3